MDKIAAEESNLPQITPCLLLSILKIIKVKRFLPPSLQGCKFSDFLLISDFCKMIKSVKDHVIILENPRKCQILLLNMLYNQVFLGGGGQTLNMLKTYGNKYL